MFKKLLTIWYPRYLHSQSETEPYIHFILGLGYSGLVIELLYMTLNLFAGIPIFPTNLPIFGFLSMLFMVRFGRSYEMTSNYFLLLMGAILVGLTCYYHSFPYTILPWFPVFSITAVYLKGRMGGLFWASIIFILMVVGLILVQDIDFGYKISPDQVLPILFVSVFLTMLSAFLASLLFSNYINKLNERLDRKNRQLVQHAKSLQEHMDEKQALIGIVCHDIANPLTVVLTSTEIAKRKKDQYPEVHLDRIQRSGRMIRDIIDEVKKLQAVESGKLQLELAPTNLVEVFNTLQFIFADRLQAKNLTLEFDYEDEKTLWVEAEEKSLTHSVLSNIISNAIKFSEPDQKIIVEVKQSFDKVHVKVRDFGIGMPIDIANNLFKQNKATSREGTQGEKGTGFGMPITKVYMEKYGGEVSVQSQEKKHTQAEDHGTTFFLTFNSVKK